MFAILSLRIITHLNISLSLPLLLMVLNLHAMLKLHLNLIGRGNDIWVGCFEGLSQLLTLGKQAIGCCWVYNQIRWFSWMV